MIHHNCSLLSFASSTLRPSFHIKKHLTKTHLHSPFLYYPNLYLQNRISVSFTLSLHSPCFSCVHIMDYDLPTPLEVLRETGPTPFITKAYNIVEDTSTNNIVSWSRDNNSFIVWEPETFALICLPIYFKHNNFSSFVRQLNTYVCKKTFILMYSKLRYSVVNLLYPL